MHIVVHLEKFDLDLTNVICNTLSCRRDYRALISMIFAKEYLGFSVTSVA